MLFATVNTSDVWTRANTTTETPGLVDLRVPMFSVFVPIFLFSVTGNTLVILTVVLLRKMKTVPMIFIANLAACDLTTTVSSIAFDLPEYELGYWPYGAVLCKIVWPLATFSTNAAALTLVAISIDRYISIICPLNLRYRITKGKCFRIIAAIYFVSALAVAPYVVILRYNEPSPHSASCGENWPDGYRLDEVYTVLLFALQYGLPLIVMSLVYIRIGLKLCKNTGKAAELSAGKTNGPRASTSSSGQTVIPSAADKAVRSLQKRKRLNEKTAKMFLFVVVIFLVFMMPHQLLWLSYEYASHTESFNQNEDLIVFVCRAFTYANSVLNPLIYGVCNGNFRRGFLSILKCQCSKGRQRNQERKAKRTETMFSANFRQQHDSFRSQTSTLDSASCMRENSTRSRSNERKGGVICDRNGNAIANGIKKSGKHLGHGVGSKLLSKNLMARDESPKNATFCTPTSKPLERNGDKTFSTRSAKSDAHKSLYDNASSRDVFQLVSDSDTLYWLSETEALLNRLCRELGTTGERGFLSEHQREISLVKENADKHLLRAKLCEEKETIL